MDDYTYSNYELFYKRGIKQLPGRWWWAIESDSRYFDWMRDVLFRCYRIEESCVWKFNQHFASYLYVTSYNVARKFVTGWPTWKSDFVVGNETLSNSGVPMFWNQASSLTAGERQKKHGMLCRSYSQEYCKKTRWSHLQEERSERKRGNRRVRAR